MHPIVFFFFFIVHDRAIIGWNFGFQINQSLGPAQAAHRTINHFYVISIESRMLNSPENMDIGATEQIHRIFLLCSITMWNVSVGKKKTKRHSIGKIYQYRKNNNENAALEHQQQQTHFQFL